MAVVSNLRSMPMNSVDHHEATEDRMIGVFEMLVNRLSDLESVMTQMSSNVKSTVMSARNGTRAHGSIFGCHIELIKDYDGFAVDDVLVNVVPSIEEDIWKPGEILQRFANGDIDLRRDFTAEQIDTIKRKAEANPNRNLCPLKDCGIPTSVFLNNLERMIACRAVAAAFEPRGCVTMSVVGPCFLTISEPCMNLQRIVDITSRVLQIIRLRPSLVKHAHIKQGTKLLTAFYAKANSDVELDARIQGINEIFYNCNLRRDGTMLSSTSHVLHSASFSRVGIGHEEFDLLMDLFSDYGFKLRARVGGRY